MYTAPVPFWITEGTTMQRTLILPSEVSVDERVEPVGELVRYEVDKLVAGYAFDFKTNTLIPQYEPNPSAGKQYHFTAYRIKGKAGSKVFLVENLSEVLETIEEDSL